MTLSDKGMEVIASDTMSIFTTVTNLLVLMMVLMTMAIWTRTMTTTSVSPKFSP